MPQSRVISKKSAPDIAEDGLFDPSGPVGRMGRPLLHRRHIYTQAVACFPCSRRIHVANWPFWSFECAWLKRNWRRTLNQQIMRLSVVWVLWVMRATEATNWKLDIYHGVGVLRSAKSLIQSDDVAFLQHLFLPKYAKMGNRATFPCLPEIHLIIQDLFFPVPLPFCHKTA